jgi:hypothetical protein
MSKENTIESFIDWCNDMEIANEAFSNFKAKLVQVFVKLINFLESKIRRMKDSKIKSALLKLLSKAKACLSKSKSLNEHDQELAKQLSEDAKAIKSEADEVLNNSESNTDNHIGEAFTDAVDNGELRRVRIMLKDSLLVDPTLKQFNAMERYASSKMKNLYDEDDGDSRELEHDKDKWTDEYMNMEMVRVVSSFTKERINLLKQIVQHRHTTKK